MICNILNWFVVICYGYLFKLNKTNNMSQKVYRTLVILNI